MLKEELKSVGLVIDFLKSVGYSATSSDKGGNTSFLHYDVICKKEGQLDRYIEIKNRRFSVADFIRYSKQGFIYENTKYQFLKDKFGFYMNVINLNGVDYIFSWYVGLNTSLRFRWESKNCRATTDFANNGYVSKMVSYVYPANAQIIKCENGEFSNIKYEDLIESLK